ncbi:hypothetical protein Vadar_029262 [Vaccinium darrowii]|uniref:Uncharacterized protein n=1 Tax=Vaccinium darrowii TaxID=229202 RepID=A0ACB7Z0Z5_9ERIC|nr:hypothetical protein Vadar_029262 [Vaccinium darrowii]
MASTVGRGAQNMNSIYIKPMLRKAYHKKGSCGDHATTKLNGEEVKNKSLVAGDSGRADGDCSWVPDHRTGIYYPKGQEKVIEDVPAGAGKDFRVNWFTNNEDFI